MEEQALKIKSIFIYPIKSCRGISVSQATVTQTGFQWDRYWLVVNYKGRAYTQKVEPKLALIESELPKEAFLEDWKPTKNSFLVVRAPGMRPLKIPLTKPSSVAEGVSMWEWTGSAFDEGEEAAKWFSDYLGKQSRLVRFNNETETRPSPPEYAAGYSTTFANTFPFMVSSQASLDKLNTILTEPVPINRFRPNILVDNCDPFGEDLWDEIKINDLVLQGVRLCSRCKLPTVNQETGVPDAAEPIETLMKFRSDKVLMPHKKPHGKATVTQTGFEWDRYWLVVNHKGRACTQNVEPKLALVEAELPKEAFFEDWEPTKNSFFVVRAPGMSLLKIPLTTPSWVAEGVSMWEWSGSAFDEGEEAAKWFSDYLGKQSRLVRFNKETECRATPPQYAVGYSTTFSNTFPFLVSSQASLDHLNTLLPEPVPMNRFRANIVVENGDPFDEDLWDEIKINDLVFKGVRLCYRCKITTMDQDTGVPSTEPIQTLRKFRSDTLLMPDKKSQRKVFFGKEMVWNWNIYNRQGKGKKTIKVGDSISILSKISSITEAAT
ncbi:unnamed protein product [Brassica oleracea]|uniref:(rape) hypothetical protein n=1 Tax=Brassica napus TaxID=3708 RepID=A0A816IXQ7_BRANA|nr:unnamed protein product [Brassica napus]